MDNNFNDSKKLVSVYNEAQLQIIRLSNIWTKCHDCIKNGDLSAYKWLLDRAWIELTADAEKINKNFYFKSIKTINKYIGRVNNDDSLYMILQNKEIFLKLLQEDAGKGGKRKSEGKSWF